ncbi:MAG: PAS domain S-box protein [Deltaproteobacteria bacterium]|nr:PAS domain S-box protein [Deltaproteobacteria bacterium]
MDTILLLISNVHDRRLIEDHLKGEYYIRSPEKDDELDGGFDLCISDSLFLKRLCDALVARTEAEKKVFLPVLMVVAKEEAGLLKAGIQPIVDEAIFTPVQEGELHMRVASLLRTRRLSKELKRHEEVHGHKERRSVAENEARYRGLFNNHHAVMLIIDPANGAIVDANPAACAYYGWSKEALSRMNIADINTLSPDQIREQMNAAQSNLRHYFEFKHRLADGAMRDVQVYSGPIHMGEHNLLYSLVFDVTEQKRMEEALQQERDFSNAILDNLPGVFYLYDGHRQFLRWNQNFERVTGYTGAEISRMRPLDFFAGGEKELLAKRIQEVFEKGASSVEADFASKDGARTPYFFTGNRIAIGGRTCLLGVGIDITERKRAEERLRQNEKLLRLFVENSPAAIAMFDRKLNYIVASRRFLSDYDLGEQDLTGRSHYDVFPEIPEHWKKIHRRCLAGGIEKAAEDPFLRRDGRMDWVRWEIRPWHETTGEIGGVILFSEVITERKQAEDEIRRRSEELAALNALGRAVSRTLSMDDVVSASIEEVLRSVRSDLAFVLVREGDHLQVAGLGPQSEARIIDNFPVHRVGECICGLAVGKGQAIYSRDIFRDPRCTWEECKQAGLRSLAALPLCIGDEIIGVLGLAGRIERDFEQQSAFLETLASQIASGLNNAILHEQLSKYATELEQLVARRTADLSVALEKARDVERVKSVFLASMSHELRTPLNSIIGFTGILLMGLTGELNPEQRKQLQMVKTNGQHLLSMINDILDISKIEAGKVSPEVESFDLRELAKEVIDNFEPQIRDKGLSLHSRLSGRITPRTDRRRMKQILLNLLSNAVKYTEEGEIKITVRKLKNDMLEIKVADTGIGIGEENLKRLFQPFQQVGMELTKSFEGTGLGLYLSQKLANLLGGEILVRSRLGKGSVFTAVLPLAVDEDSAVFMAEGDFRGKT